MPEHTKRLLVRVNPALRHSHERTLSLDGKWLFRLDPQDEGLDAQWFKDQGMFSDAILVPGCWQGQGYGHDGEDEVWDFRLRARTLRATYRGTGWYGRAFELPKDWRGQRIWLNFGGAHPSAQVWLNGIQLGEHAEPFIPFGFDITDTVSFEQDNLLAVRISEENRWLGLSYSWQGCWSGLYRSVELTATGGCWLERCMIYPDADAERLRLDLRLGGDLDQGPLTVAVAAAPLGAVAVAEATKKVNQREMLLDLPIRAPRLWSPDEPNLYRVDVQLSSGNKIMDAMTERVGFLKLSTAGKHFLINGQPYYVRESGDFAINPETGSPDTDRDRWRKKLATLRQYGYNYVRCQSYAPTPEYYDAADEVGLLVQGEMGALGAWGGSTIWHVYGWPQPLPEFRKALREQWLHTVMRDVNHPSASIYCMSNELGQSTLFPRTAWDCYRETKRLKPAAFVIWTDGGYHRDLPGDFVNAEADMDKVTPLPVIQHEFRWWSSYPDIRLKSRYTEAIRPYALEIAESAARRNGMEALLPRIAHNSQRLQHIEARGKLEACRRDNPTLAGICHFNAMDAGPSPQGIVNEFCEAKYVDAATWLQTNGNTTILLDRDFDDRVLLSGETFEAGLSISDFSHPPFDAPRLDWKLCEGEKCLASGSLAWRHEPFCTCGIPEKISLTLPEVSRPLALKLSATMCEGTRSCHNQWSFWLFPKGVGLPEQTAIYGSVTLPWLKALAGRLPAMTPGRLGDDCTSLLLTECLNAQVTEYIAHGGRALLAASEGLLRPFYPKLGLNVGRYYFLPPANYPPYEDGNSGTIVQQHPALGELPHEGFCDLQFYCLIAESPPIDLAPLGPFSGEPIIRAISTYFTCRPLAYLLELGLGKGGLIISSLNLDQAYPEARYLLSAIARYALSDAFRPKDELSREALQYLQENTSW